MRKITFLFLLTGLFTYGQNFTDVTGSLPQLSYSLSAWGDYDGDGDLDLFYTGYLNANNPGGGGLFENDNGSFNLVANSGLPQYDYGEADWADFDGDGDLDLVIMGYDETLGTGTALTDIYLNNNDGTFTAANSGIMGVYMGDVHFVDVNNDNQPDVAITGMETTGWTNILKIYINNGDGTVTDSSNTFPSLNIGQIEFADFDNDGDQDLVVNGWENTANTPYTKIWVNDGAGNFTESTVNLAQLWLGDLGWSDVDNDGDMDLLITGTAAANSEMHLYINDGNSNFTEDSHFVFTPVHQSEVVFADFDNDGDEDLFLMGRHYSAVDEFYASYLYMNDNGVFSENTNFAFVAAIYGDADAGDYDNNGYPDLFICGNDINNFGVGKIYQNESANIINSNGSNEFNIYPNPANEWLEIKSENQSQFSILISDITGQIVYQNEAQSLAHIDLQNFMPGIYLVEIIENKQSFTRKIIIK